ncbi:FIG01231397: hypothetical protein [uncultured Candidatus Thioglobus sp.]|nr:FIG01231397: hypothetical protein [uncultured Candidatus Thioglobus sp.]
MITNSNPWQDMPESTQRRVKYDTHHSLFWITDLEGKYGFLLQSKDLFDDTKLPANLKGIELLKRNSTYGYGELFLVLNDKEDWQIFYVLCNDLVSITDSYDSDKAMINAVEIRLKRWQQLLKQNRDMAINLQKQMGLFTELLCLKDVITPKYGIEQAIVSWVGADSDKQDFLLDKAIIEVKSYKTSKGQTAHISSIKQLISDKTPLFLLTYGMTETENGQSVADIVEDINIQLKSESNEIKNNFEKKLLEYGYMPEVIKMPLHKFIVDKSRVFLTSGNFPKIQQDSIKHGIMDVKYSIDLLECSDFEKDVLNFLG